MMQLQDCTCASEYRYRQAGKPSVYDDYKAIAFDACDNRQKSMAGIRPTGDVDNWTASTTSWTDSSQETSNYTGNTVTSLSDPVIRVVGSHLERILFELYLSVCLVSATMLNALVLAVIARDSRLHTPENLIIACDALNNLALTLFGTAHSLWLITYDTTTHVYHACQISGFMAASCFLLSLSLSFRLWIPQVRGQSHGFFSSIQLDFLHPPR